MAKLTPGCSLLGSASHHSTDTRYINGLPVLLMTLQTSMGVGGETGTGRGVMYNVMSTTNEGRKYKIKSRNTQKCTRHLKHSEV
jgi:hypothetical protein